MSGELLSSELRFGFSRRLATLRKKNSQYTLSQCAFFGAKGLKGLSSLLWVSPQHLKRLSEQGPSAYKEWDEEKSSGGIRHIEAPRVDLKKLQRRISKLLMRIEPPDYLFCPVRRRDFLQNANQHAGARVVWTVDIEAYFQNTPYPKVYAFFRNRMKCAGDLSTLLTRVTTVNGHLATGSPASPILAYFSNEAMWDEIAKLAAKFNCQLTIYMDDLTISGDSVSYDLREGIKKIIGSAGFRAHKECLYKNQAAIVTGVATGVARLSLPHAFYKRRRLKRIALRSAPLEEANVLERSLRGMDQLTRLAVQRRTRP